jgi:hypothetical protein
MYITGSIQATTEFDKIKKALFGGYGQFDEDGFEISEKNITGALNLTNEEPLLINKDVSFSEYIENCCEILKNKKEPYFTLIKKNFKKKFFKTDVIIDDLYKKQMRDKLQLILNKTYYNNNSVLEEVTWILDEYITEENTAVSKEVLFWLNQEFKKN